MGFNNHRAVVDAELSGAHLMCTWRKTPTQVTAAGIWFDLSMSPGNPVPNYYASSPLVAVAMAQSTDGGIRHGGNVSPDRKTLRKLMALTVAAGAVPLPMMLLDYLLYYPFIDESLVDEEQLLDNTTTLPRYTDGAGVQMMAIVVAGQTGGQPFSVNYTNSAGVAGRTSQSVTMNTQAVNGTVLTSAPATAGCRGPFIPLQAGDKGVRSIEGVTVTGAGDVGLFTLVLVKPIANHSLRGIDAPTETDFLVDFSLLPQIVDDAYLNFICCPAGSLTGAPIHGTIETIWG